MHVCVVSWLNLRRWSAQKGDAQLHTGVLIPAQWCSARPLSCDSVVLTCDLRMAPERFMGGKPKLLGPSITMLPAASPEPSLLLRPPAWFGISTKHRRGRVRVAVQHIAAHHTPLSENGPQPCMLKCSSTNVLLRLLPAHPPGRTMV